MIDVNLPYVLKVMPYRIEYYVDGNYTESIVLGKDMIDAINTLIKDQKVNIWEIESIELCRLQDSKILLTKYT